MNKKAHELEVRNIMQGIEEFANFMSFQSTTFNLKIISIESVDEDRRSHSSIKQEKADILDITPYLEHKKERDQPQVLEKSLFFVS